MESQVRVGELHPLVDDGHHDVRIPPGEVPGVGSPDPPHSPLVAEQGVVRRALRRPGTTLEVPARRADERNVLEADPDPFGIDVRPPPERLGETPRQLEGGAPLRHARVLDADGDPSRQPWGAPRIHRHGKLLPTHPGHRGLETGRHVQAGGIHARDALGLRPLLSFRAGDEPGRDPVDKLRALEGGHGVLPQRTAVLRLDPGEAARLVRGPEGASTGLGRLGRLEPEEDELELLQERVALVGRRALLPSDGQLPGVAPTGAGRGVLVGILHGPSPPGRGTRDGGARAAGEDLTASSSVLRPATAATPGP